MKTSDLTGKLLDEWVARAEGYTIGELTGSPGSRCVGKNGLCMGMLSGGDTMAWLSQGVYNPSSDPKKGQPIMERLRIALVPLGGQWAAFQSDGKGAAGSSYDPEFYIDVSIEDADGTGPTMLIAGMRAVVAKAYGDTVPDEAAA